MNKHAHRQDYGDAGMCILEVPLETICHLGEVLPTRVPSVNNAERLYRAYVKQYGPSAAAAAAIEQPCFAACRLQLRL